MYLQPKGPGVNSPPRPYYNNPGLPPSPPVPQVSQPIVAMEQVQRKIPPYNFKTIHTQNGREREKYFETNSNSSRHQLVNSQSNTYGTIDKIKDLDATFNPNQFDNGIFSRTYQSTVTLRGTDGKEGRKSGLFPETDTEKFFSNYAKGTGEERPSSFYQPSRKESSEVFLYQSSKKQQQFPSSSYTDTIVMKKDDSFPPMKKANFMETYYESVVEPTKIIDKPVMAASYSSLSYMQEKQYKEKVASLTQQLTKTSMQKGQLLLEVSQLTKQNKQLKDQNKLLEEEKRILSGSSDIISELKDETVKNKQEIDKWKEENKVLKEQKNQLQTSISQLKKQVEELKTAAEQQPKGGIWIDEQILLEIDGIKQRQVEIGKLKEQFMMILENKYGEQMKRLTDMNNTFKTELQNMKFDLNMAKESAKDKQIKVDYIQKEVEALESKARAQSKSIKEQVEGELREKSSQIIGLKHALHSLQIKYKAQRKQLADKDDFITKYLASKAGEDAQTIKILIEKYNFYSRQQFEEISQGQGYTPQTPISK